MPADTPPPELPEPSGALQRVVAAAMAMFALYMSYAFIASAPANEGSLQRIEATFERFETVSHGVPPTLRMVPSGPGPPKATSHFLGKDAEGRPLRLRLITDALPSPTGLYRNRTVGILTDPERQWLYEMSWNGRTVVSRRAADEARSQRRLYVLMFALFGFASVVLVLLNDIKRWMLLRRSAAGPHRAGGRMETDTASRRPS